MSHFHLDHISGRQGLARRLKDDFTIFFSRLAVFFLLDRRRKIAGDFFRFLSLHAHEHVGARQIQRALPCPAGLRIAERIGEFHFLFSRRPGNARY
jgi:glyoxylase-like metal-dependent hydrolase (beta-lactamase superfamily II)